MTNGEIVFEDDPSIAAADPIWRRIPPGRYTFDHNEGRIKPVSGNFKYSSADPQTGRKDPMSVTLGAGLTAHDALAGHPAGFTLVGWSAGEIRAMELGICRDEQPDVLAHGLVFNLQVDAAGNRKTNIPGPVSKRLANAAQWVVALSADEIEAVRLRTLPDDN